MSNSDEEVDLFELSAKPPAPLNGFGRDERSFETETNVFSIEFDKTTGPKIATPAAPVAAPKPSPFDLDDIDLDDDDMPKPGFFGRLFGKKRAADDFDDDFDIGLPKKVETPATIPAAPAAVDDVFDLSASITAASPAAAEDVFDLSASIPAAAPAPAPKISAPIPASPPASLSTPAPPPPAPTPVPAPPQPMFGRIAHVCLFVRNLAASVNYYSALGMKQRFAFNKKGRVYGAYMEFGEGGNFIELFEDPIQAISPNGRLAHFCLQTPDIDAVTAFLTSRGIKFTPKKFGCDATYQIWLKDPDGNDFEIHQYTPKSSQIIGGDVEVDW